MWIVFGGIAIIATFLNLYMYKVGKNYKLAMAVGLSFSSLTICSEYSILSEWVQANDWAALADVVPTMKNALWVLTIISIVLNMTPILLELKKE
ncbi:hypothetical protein KLL63_06550 [Clostridioides difficile]|nr:hypothetical protein [Clostridioides difficile]